MECERIREAVSARLDGEDPGLPDEPVTAHLEACQACRAWQERAHEVTRRARLSGPFLDHDLTPRVLAAAATAAGPEAARPGLNQGRLRQVRRAALCTVAAAQLAITVPLLVLGHDHGAGLHAAHELGSFDLALAIAFAVGGLRPALSAGLAWPCGIAALGLAVTAITDLLAGQAPGAIEAQHLIALAGAALLFWQARTEPGGPWAARPGTDAAAVRQPDRWRAVRHPGGRLSGYRPGVASRPPGAPGSRRGAA